MVSTSAAPEAPALELYRRAGLPFIHAPMACWVAPPWRTPPVRESLPATFVGTRDEQRDGHLKGGDFFDVEKFPTMTFKSFKVLPAEQTVEGELTIKGVTKTVAFEVEGPTEPAKDPWGNLRVAVTATTKINRKEFGLTWNAALETGGLMVGEDISITLDLQFVKQA